MRSAGVRLFKPLTVVLAFFLVVFLTGCESDKPDLQDYVAEVKAQSQPDIPPIPVMPPYEKFDYAAAELRDPFVPTVVDVPQTLANVDGSTGIQPDGNRRKEALEFFELADLQFVGTLEQDNVWALIRAPDSVIHKVSVGNYMGKNHGEILAIGDSEITLREVVPEGNGFVERETSLSVTEIN